MNKQAKFIMDSLLVFINASTKHEKNSHGHVQYLVCKIFITNSIISLTGTVSNHDVSTSCSTHVILLLMSLHLCLKYLPFWLLLIYHVSPFPLYLVVLCLTSIHPLCTHSCEIVLSVHTLSGSIFHINTIKQHKYLFHHDPILFWMNHFLSCICSQWRWSHCFLSLFSAFLLCHRWMLSGNKQKQAHKEQCVATCESPIRWVIFEWWGIGNNYILSLAVILTLPNAESL